MLHNTRFYDLSYVFPDKKTGSKARVVLSIDQTNLEEVTRRLYILVHRQSCKSYFGEERYFKMPIPDLFGRLEFGFGGCGVVSQHERQISLGVELSETKVFEAALTLHFLLAASAIPAESSGFVSNQRQQLELSTVCSNTRIAYGHAVGGRVSYEMVAWLRKYAARKANGKSVQLPPKVLKAMRSAWAVLAKKGSKHWASHCGGYVTADGRFILECFGNACDVAIYPDSFFVSEEYGTEFGCHNLDSASQQLTLLAGLAKLCELARQIE